MEIADLVADGMRQQLQQRLTQLVAQHPDKRVSVDFDFDSVVHGRPKVVIRVKENK